MPTRSEALLQLRPQIPVLLEATTSTAEQFQNCCLRPILKLQNELLLEVYRHYIYKRKNVYQQLSNPERLAYIEQSLQKDQRLKELLCGLIIGHFSTEEWQQFVAEEAELRRRLIALLIQRLQSQSEILAKS